MNAELTVRDIVNKINEEINERLNSEEQIKRDSLVCSHYCGAPIFAHLAAGVALAEAFATVLGSSDFSRMLIRIKSKRIAYIDEVSGEQRYQMCFTEAAPADGVDADMTISALLDEIHITATKKVSFFVQKITAVNNFIAQIFHNFGYYGTCAVFVPPCFRIFMKLPPQRNNRFKQFFIGKFKIIHFHRTINTKGTGKKCPCPIIIIKFYFSLVNPADTSHFSFMSK